MYYSKMTLFLKFILISTAILFSAACAHKPPIEKISSSANPSEEIQISEDAINDARSQQVDVFAPQNFKKAVRSLEYAKIERSRQKKNERVLEDVAESRAWLNRAKQKAQVAKTATSSLEQSRMHAIEAGAPRSFDREFAKVDRDMKSFTDEMEEGDLGNAEKKSAKLEARYRELEVKAVRANLLGPAIADVNTAIKEGAKKSAPKSLAAAESKIAAANAAIEANPRNLSALRASSEAASTESAHALLITRQAKAMQSRTAEDLVLKSEMQERAIVSLAQEKNRELASAKATNEELEETSADTQSRLAALQEKQNLQNKIEAVRNNFTPEEADVLQDGDKVLIRLKSLNFKSGQASLEPEHFNLLKKVQDSLKELKASDVVIEGHTDSLGKAESNRTLSKKRAQAVEQYLVSNKAVESAQVETKGLGFDQPIAPDKTAAGRAQNRRVDLIITTE